MNGFLRMYVCTSSTNEWKGLKCDRDGETTEI